MFEKIKDQLSGNKPSGEKSLLANPPFALKPGEAWLTALDGKHYKIARTTEVLVNIDRLARANGLD